MGKVISYRDDIKKYKVSFGDQWVGWYSKEELEIENSLQGIVENLVEMVGESEVMNILKSFRDQVEGFSSMEARLKECKTLIVCHNTELAGG